VITNIKGKPVQICNISHKRFHIRRSYNWGGLIVEPCPKDKPYVSSFIEDQMDEKVNPIDHWAEHSIHTPFPIDAKDIAQDFFLTENLLNNGCFVPAGEIPTEQEIANAKATRRAYLKRLVAQGDAAYSIGGRIDDIPGEWKEAANELKMNVEWSKQAPEEKTACPACGNDLPRPDVAICGSCHAILDRKRAIEFGLIEAPAEDKPKGKVI